MGQRTSFSSTSYRTSVLAFLPVPRVLTEECILQKDNQQVKEPWLKAWERESKLVEKWQPCLQKQQYYSYNRYHCYYHSDLLLYLLSRHCYSFYLSYSSFSSFATQKNSHFVTAAKSFFSTTEIVYPYMKYQSNRQY